MLSTLISGCASVKYQSPPPLSTNNVKHELTKFTLSKQANLALRPLNQGGDILYTQNFGGGGIGVGLLLGPIGALANGAAIESNTDDDVELLKEKLNFNSSEILKKSIDKHSVELAVDGDASIELSPYIYVSKTDNEQLLFASAIIVENKMDKDNYWSGKYMYQTKVKMAKADIADGVSAEEFIALKTELEKGFDELIRLYKEDSKGSLKMEKELTFISDFVSPRFNFEMVGDLVPSDTDRVNIRTVGAVYSLPRDSVTLKFKKTKS